MSQDKQQTASIGEPTPASSPLPSSGMVILGIICAVPASIYGMALTCCGLGLFGVGHGGWAISVLAWPSVIFVTMLGFAWGFYESRFCEALLAPILAYAVLTDVAFVLFWDEDFYRRGPDNFQYFLVAWGGWQVALLALIIIRITMWVKWFLTRGQLKAATLADGHTNPDVETGIQRSDNKKWGELRHE